MRGAFRASLGPGGWLLIGLALLPGADWPVVPDDPGCLSAATGGQAPDITTGEPGQDLPVDAISIGSVETPLPTAARAHRPSLARNSTSFLLGAAISPRSPPSAVLTRHRT